MVGCAGVREAKRQESQTKFLEAEAETPKRERVRNGLREYALLPSVYAIYGYVRGGGGVVIKKGIDGSECMNVDGEIC